MDAIYYKQIIVKIIKIEKDPAGEPFALVVLKNGRTALVAIKAVLFG